VIAKIRKIISTDLVKVSSLNAVATLIKMLTGFVSVKVIAVIIGPPGVALLGQLNNFSTIFLTMSAGGINSGITRYTSQHRNSKKRYMAFLRTGFRITASLSMVSGLVLVFGATYFSRLILKDAQYKVVFVIFGFTVILYALNAFLVATINGFRAFKKYVTINILSSVVGLIFSIVLATNFGLYGALISAVTYQSVVFLVTLTLVTKMHWFKWRELFGRFSKSAALKLGHYSIMALASTVTVPVAQLFVRNHIVVSRSIHDAGIWEGMNRISAMYLTVITTSLSVYYLPKLSGLSDSRLIRKEIFTVYKFIIPLLFCISTVIFLFRNQVVHILFNHKFDGMQDFFAFQLAGDVMKMAAWTLAYLLLAKAMTKVFIFNEIFFSLSFVLLSLFFTNRYGAIGASMAYLTNYSMNFIFMLIVFRKLLFQPERNHTF